MLSQIEEITRNLNKGILCWYDLKAGKRALLIAGQDDPLTDILRDAGVFYTCLPMDKFMEDSAQESVDYIIAVGALEYSDDPAEFLQKCKRTLAADGTLLLGTDNRLGLKYFCGDRDPFSGRNFDGIENYRKVRPEDRAAMAGRAYDRFEIEGFLTEAGFLGRKFYSVFPDIRQSQLIYAEDCMPNEELSARYFPKYNSPDTVFLDEEYLYTDIINNGMFHMMANAYFVECPLNGEFSSAAQVTLSMERGFKYSCATVIKNDNTVEKRGFSPESREHLAAMMEYTNDLNAHGISTVGMTLKNERIVMPFVEEKSAITYLQRLAFEDVDEFVAQMDRFRDVILRSGDAVCEQDMDKVSVEFLRSLGIKEPENDNKNLSLCRKLTFVKRCYWDLVPINAFVIDGEFVFYDQEFYEENCPIELLTARLLDLVYKSSVYRVLPKKFFLERYGIEDTEELLMWKANDLLAKLRNREIMREYNQRLERDYDRMILNRQRMNFSAEEYERLFVGIFDNLENKKLFIFGAGRYAQKFVTLYGDRYKITAVLDNSEEKQGLTVGGVTVQSPYILRELAPSTYKVIICVRNYMGVLRQIKELGATNIGIYDISMQYPRKLPMISDSAKGVADGAAGNAPASAKKYHVGYVAGVFDLFHIGHLNLLRRAKEQCDYLIVGVVTDKGVRDNKKTECMIPFEERLAVVQACRYVDEAVRIPPEYHDTEDAWKRFQFDVQFSGSDYVDAPDWIAKREFLREHGADLVFFPYTESTSSTKIKELISRRLV